jgi:predicted RNase H-like HicB family nuclease
MSIRVTAAVTREGGWYVAQCLEIDVASQGETIEQALGNLREALELRLEGEPLPASSMKEPPLIAQLELELKPSTA